MCAMKTGLMRPTYQNNLSTFEISDMWDQCMIFGTNVKQWKIKWQKIKDHTLQKAASRNKKAELLGQAHVAS